MSPLRPTTASSRASAKHAHISPLGIVMCALATLVTVPVLLSQGAGGDTVEVAAVPVITEPAAETSASQLDADIEIDGMFDAGARVDEVPQAPVPEPDPGRAGSAVVDGSGAAGSASVEAADPGPVTPEAVEASPQRTGASSSDTAPAATAPPTTAPPATAAPATTAPPETAAPTTAPPATAPPETEAPAPEEAAVAAEPAPVAEAPQAAPVEAAAEPEAVPAAAPTQPTAEQWAALRRCESSGSYTIVSANGLYHGAYQFYQPTWDGLARQAGRADLVGLAPSQAAPADQDALALLLWQQRGNQPWPHCGRHLPAGP